MKVLDAIWFSKVGMVFAYDEITKEIKVYIANTCGHDKKEDTEYILAWGSKVPLAMLNPVMLENYLEVAARYGR